jgi:hypothetical protein
MPFAIKMDKTWKFQPQNNTAAIVQWHVNWNSITICSQYPVKLNSIQCQFSKISGTLRLRTIWWSAVFQESKGNKVHLSLSLSQNQHSFNTTSEHCFGIKQKDTFTVTVRVVYKALSSRSPTPMCSFIGYIYTCKCSCVRASAKLSHWTKA